MTEIEVIKPCYAGCVRVPATDDQSALLFDADHGHFCGREFNRIRAAVILAPAVIEHVVSVIEGQAQSDGRVDATKDAPVPFNVQAFNDANEIYQRLVYWCRLWSDRLRIPGPAPAVRSWRSENGTVIGLPADASPEGARYVAEIMSRWLELNLESICYQDPEDVLFFQDEMKDVFRISARFPTRMRARYADVHCPDDSCGGRLVVYPPEQFMDDQRIVCEQCGRHIMPDDYSFMVRVMEQQKTEEKKAGKVQARLARKYA